MFYEWDPAKNEVNLAKHGIDFEDAIGIFRGRTVEREDTRRDYGERRWVVLGVMQERVIVLVYTDRRNRRRIISARSATQKERRLYAEDE